jgi:hypothetical protein
MRDALGFKGSNVCGVLEALRAEEATKIARKTIAKPVRQASR